MKVKTSITLSDKLLEAVDKRAGQHKKTRSDFIEVAVRAFIGQLIRNEQNARDLEIINRRADFLNQETNDVLEYQAPFRQRPPTRGQATFDSSEDSAPCGTWQYTRINRSFAPCRRS